MVFVDRSFLDSNHGKIECVACHKGDAKSFTKESAHIDLVAQPSEQAGVFCAGCHKDVVQNYDKSLHANLDGYYNRIANRLGYSIVGDAAMDVHFQQDCGKCHSNCGQCHVSRPVSVQGGFLSGHTFKTPERDNNCTACHGSRVGAEYLGENEGYQADVHRYKPGGSTCTMCHSGSEMHSSGQTFHHRYADTDMPRCEDCHTGVETANHFHEVHWANKSLPKLACQVCHSQDYKNCNGCHTGQGITGSSYFKFKIAKNEFGLESAGRDYDYVTVRHIPIVPDTYTSWGIGDLPNFDAEPTWKYTTPHNIQRWTTRTDTTGVSNCYDNCHNSAEYYLTTDDLFDFEKEANKNIILDDKLND